MIYKFLLYLKKITICLSLLGIFFVFQKLSAQTITYQLLNKHTYQIKWKLNGLRFEKNDFPSSAPENSGVIPHFDNSILVPVQNQPLLPQTGFSLIWPYGGKPTITTTVVNKEVLQNIQIPIYTDTSDSGYPEDTQSSPSIIQSGGVQVFQKIPVHNFRVKPFLFDQNLKTLTIFSEVLIIITFGDEFEPVINSVASKKSVELLGQIVLNVDQFQFHSRQNIQRIEKKNFTHWYNPNKQYLKVYVVKDGIYHLKLHDFSQAGMNLSGMNLQNLTCYYRGEPYPIFVDGEIDGNFDDFDYIEFIGFSNPGENQFYNDYSDTSVYWFTFENDLGLRINFRSVAPGKTAPLSAFYHVEHREEDHIYHSGGDENEINIFNSDRTPGEGWIWERIYAGDEFTYNVTAFNYADSPQPDSLKIKVRGLTNDRSQNPDHHLKISINKKDVSELYFDGVKDVIHNFEIPKGIIKLGKNEVTLRSVEDTGAQYDAIYLDWFELCYPRIFIASDNQLFFSIPNSLVNKPVRVNITNFHQDSIVVYDLKNKTKLINFQIQSYSDRFYISMSDSVFPQNKYAAYAIDSIQKPARIILDPSSDLRNTIHQADYLIVTHKKFIQQAKELAAFRQQRSGLIAFVADIENIFDEFNYGLVDPLATRSFIKYTVGNWSKPAPLFVLFFGDASWDFKKNSKSSVNENFVPSYGNPVADNRLVSVDGENDFLPDLYAGRIPIATTEEAEALIAKISAYEASPFSNWQKNVIFLNGGFDDFEQNIFKSQSENIIKSYVVPGPFGGNPVRIYKEADGLVVGELQGDILSAINNGALWLSFLGHAGSETWDLMLRNENILELENSGKYPFITSMTCHTARFANPAITSFGELFLKVPDKGAVAFWGTTGWGYIYQDNILINQLFRLMLREKNLTLGEATTMAKLFLWNLLGDSQINRSTIDQYTLLGDPVLQLAYPTKPDFAIKNSDVKISPEEPTEEDSILFVEFLLNNYGLVLADSLDIEVKLNSTMVKRLKIETPAYAKDVKTSISLSNIVGEVNLEISLDPENQIQELLEENNMAQLDFYVYTTTISISKPPHFSVLKDPQPILQVYSPESSGEMIRNYFFELDTSNSFDSPFLVQSTGMSETKIVTRWQVPQILEDGAYFWRCRLFDGSQYSKWLQSSFQIKHTGETFTWEQNPNLGLSPILDKNLTFENNAATLAKDRENAVHLEVQSAGFEDGSRCYLIVNYEVLNQPARGHHLIVIDSSTGQVISGPISYDTYADSSAANAMADFIHNQPANSLFLVGIKDEGSFAMTQKAYSALESIGSKYCRDVNFRDSWAMIGRKGAVAGAVPEVWLPKGNGTAVARDTLNIFYYKQGALSSGIIGPAQNWNHLDWNIEFPNSKTHFLLKISGLNRQSKNWDTLQEIDQGKNYDLNSISPRDYPTLKIELNLFSDDGLSTPIFSSWQIDYDLPPDFTTHPALFSIQEDSLLEGLPIHITAPIYNVGFPTSDSTIVQIELEKSQADWDSVTSKPVFINADDSVQIEFRLPTEGYQGESRFRITIDPRNKINELSEINNQYTGKIFVQVDSIRPDIKITFDDQEILPGDLVSSEPTIKVSFKDNSPLAIQDTSLIRLFLNDQPLYFKKLPEQLELIPNPVNVSNGTESVVIYQPKLKSGQYVLEIIANDVTQNTAYSRADFNVSSELSLRAVLNVPNPFSSETDFTYILTQPANHVSLSIFTVAGRLIYNVNDLPNNTGFNSYHWHALDADGDEIANGVYLYKIEAYFENKSVSEINKFIIVK